MDIIVFAGCPGEYNLDRAASTGTRVLQRRVRHRGRGRRSRVGRGAYIASPCLPLMATHGATSLRSGEVHGVRLCLPGTKTLFICSFLEHSRVQS